MPDCPGLTQTLRSLRDHCDSVALDSAPEAGWAILKQDLQSLSARIDAVLGEMGRVDVQGILQLHVPVATDQLDAIITHTERATNTILDECERLDLAAADMWFQLDVSAATARIYEACSFQDVTAQRVTKVIQVLQAIEAKSAEFLRVMGGSPAHGTDRPDTPVLLNGPQHPRVAMSQAAVDELIGTLS